VKGPPQLSKKLKGFSAVCQFSNYLSHYFNRFILYKNETFVHYLPNLKNIQVIGLDLSELSQNNGVLPFFFCLLILDGIK